jgi:hypothetical protein
MKGDKYMQNPVINLENLRRFLENLRATSEQTIGIHASDYNNPHKVTKLQISLGNVDNTSDANKPVSAAQKTYIDAQDASILASGKSYTDSAKSSAITTAASDATTKTNAIQTNLNTHISNITDAHDIANKLQALKSFMIEYSDQGDANIVGGAPEILNTLRELSTAIGNDPNLSVTLTSLIGQKFSSSDVVDLPAINKVLRLNANAQYPASVIAQDSNNRLFTDAERSKLAGIATGATNYTHPTNHPPSIITQDTNNRFVSDAEKSIWNAKQNALSLVTQTVNGIMSYPDKIKIDGIENGANKTIITNNLIATVSGTVLDAIQGKILNDTKAPNDHASVNNTYGWGDNLKRGHVAVTAGNGLNISNGLISMGLATVSGNGAFASLDKIRLDNMEDNANNYTHPSTHLPSIIVQDSNNRFFTDAERTKLSGISNNANNYTHPINHPPSIITQDSNNRFFTDAERLKLSGIDTFLNLDPKIGFYGDDDKALIFASFDISKNAPNPAFVISDNRSIEYLYFFANNGEVGTPFRLRRANRRSESQAWKYSNEEIRPSYLAANERIDSMRGVGVEWIIHSIYNETTSTSRWWLIKTLGSGKIDQWIKYKDITSLYEDSIMGSVYFPEYDTLLIISRNAQRIDMKLVNITTMANIISKTTLISNIDSMIDYSGWDVPKTTVPWRNHGEATCFYNEEDQQLVIYCGLSYITGSVGGTPTGLYRTLFFPFKVSAPIYFKTGVGNLTLTLTPLVDYKHLTAGKGMGTANSDSSWISYDKYRKRIYAVYTGQSVLNSRITGVPLIDRPQTYLYAYDGQVGATTYLSPPDASPWAKLVYSPAYFHNNVLYFNGRSDKYGDRRIATEYDPSILKNNQYFKLIANTWYVEDQEGSSAKGNHNNTAIIRVNATTNRYINYDRASIVEIIHQDFIGTDRLPKKGKHVESVVTNPIPTLPSIYNYLGQCYDPIKNRAFFVVSDKTSSDPAKQGFPFLLYWTPGTGFVEYRNIALWESYASLSKNSLTYVNFQVNSNFFIDLDGLVYVTCSYRTLGSGCNGRETFIIDISKSTPVTKYTANMVPHVHADNVRIGYDNYRGYFISGGSSESELLISYDIRFSKSFKSGEAEKTKDQFFEGQYYTANIDLAPGVGLIAYLQPTPIFLGGYYSTSSAEEIPLTANADNYIYLERDASDISKINVVRSTSLIGGEKGFGRALVSKITTNSEIIIAQEDYPVQTKLVPITHVGSKGIDQHALGDGTNAGFTTNDYTTAEKNKLSGIAVSANNYSHPANHPASIITQDANNRFVTDVEKTKWNTAETAAKSYADTKVAEVYSKQPIGSKGQVYYMKNDNSSEVQLGQILSTGRFVETSAELSDELAKVISFGTIFNTWERFRVGGTTGEENAWNYNSTLDQVVCTINSNGFIGFVSLDKYDKYTHEVTLSSTDGDDDMIGAMIAYYKDPTTGKIYTLHATRSTKLDAQGGNGPAWGIVYNWAQSDQTILYQTDSIKANLGWSTAGATRLRITRNGDIVTCETTAFGNVTTYLDSYKQTIDLSSNSILEKFRGPKQYGYCCMSQAASTFSNVVFSDISSMIFDLSTNKVYTFKSGAWSIDATKTVMSEVGPGKLISNPNTGKLFFIKDENNILPITTKVPLASNLTTTSIGTALDASQGKILQDTKEASITAGTTSQYWKGNKSWADLSTDVRAITLAGLSITNSIISASDTILSAPGKLQAQITAHRGSKGVSEHGLGDGTNAGFSVNDYTSAEKTKLAGITAGANVYTHPSTHPVSMITGLATVATSGDYNSLSNKPISYGTADLTAGTSPLATGTIYIVYS